MESKYAWRTGRLVGEVEQEINTSSALDVYCFRFSFECTSIPQGSSAVASTGALTYHRDQQWLRLGRA